MPQYRPTGPPDVDTDEMATLDVMPKCEIERSGGEMVLGYVVSGRFVSAPLSAVTTAAQRTALRAVLKAGLEHALANSDGFDEVE